VAGDAAVLVDPYDPESIAEGIRRVLTDEALRLELGHRGLEQAGRYSWELSVEKTRQVYEEVLGAPAE
jgi:glycosyltransferase involved in cell wall biosynthesis